MFRLLRRILLRTPKGGFCPLPRDYCPAPGDPPDQPAPEVLVVEGEAGFTPDLVEQAVAFAKRLGYGLVALSCLPEGDVEQDDHRGPWNIPSRTAGNTWNGPGASCAPWSSGPRPRGSPSATWSVSG